MGTLGLAQRLTQAGLLLLLRAAGFTGEGKDLLQQVHHQTQDPERQKRSSHADDHHGESEGPLCIVHVVLFFEGQKVLARAAGYW